MTPAADELPPLSLLDHPDKKSAPRFSKQSLDKLAKRLETRLLVDFGIEAQVVDIHLGPVFKIFELELAPGVKIAQITKIQHELARILSAVALRVVDSISGKSSVGIEIRNEVREMVSLSEVLTSQTYQESNSLLSIALGSDIGGTPVAADLQKMPHLLVAGVTGSGKSVFIDALILSIVYKTTPEQAGFIMINPGRSGLSIYEGIPHLLTPIVTEMKRARNALRWSISEMVRRYRRMAILGARDLAGYHRKVLEAADTTKLDIDPNTGHTSEGEVFALKPFPLIVIIVDDLADLMAVEDDDFEELVLRLARDGHRAGIHLVLSTQTPSVDGFSSVIKASIPSRIAFQMSSRVDSLTILDQDGAEQLLGQGDMLFLQPGQVQPKRMHGAFVSDDEVHKVATWWKLRVQPVRDQAVLTGEFGIGGPGFVQESGGEVGESGGNESDPLYDEAVKIVTETRRASIAGIQRRLRIGYNRAARLIEEMERTGLVGPMQPSGSREVIAAPPADMISECIDRSWWTRIASIFRSWAKWQ